MQLWCTLRHALIEDFYLGWPDKYLQASSTESTALNDDFDNKMFRK